MLILLVHGLCRTPLSLVGLAAALRRNGHYTRFFAYSPTFESVPGIVRRLSNRIRSLGRRDRPIGLLGHSLGGLLLRLALDHVPECRVHHLVMLGTPNRGSRMAELASRWRPFRILTGDYGRLLASRDRFTNCPQPNVPLTVIAGTAGPCGRLSPLCDQPNDGIVTVEEATLGAGRLVRLPTFHTFMMNATPVRQVILSAFAT